MKIYPVKLTSAQAKAVEAAFPDSPATFSDKLRWLVADGLTLRQVAWPPSPRHGGVRPGAGRKKRTPDTTNNTPG